MKNIVLNTRNLKCLSDFELFVLAESCRFESRVQWESLARDVEF